jgi:hypothetical protein
MTCNKQMIQTKGWFLGSAEYFCPHCSSDQPKEKKNSKYEFKYTPYNSLSGTGYGIYFDTRTDMYWTEYQWNGKRLSASETVRWAKKNHYNGLDNWALPLGKDLLSLTETAAIVPFVHATWYWAYELVAMSSNGVVANPSKKVLDDMDIDSFFPYILCCQK